jgi:hypothetical protein
MALTFEQVMECVQKENDYAQKWAKGSRKLSVVEGVSDADVHSGTTGPVGQPFGISDWWCFARKYWNEIPDAMAAYTPDGGAVRIRMIKVVSLLVRALMIYGRPSDIERIAGKSSRDFPILSGGIKTFDEMSSAQGCLIPTAETRALRNEAPGCDPLKN